MKRLFSAILILAMIAGCAGMENKFWKKYDLPAGYQDSHILSIDIRGNEILVGTYGKGALFSSDSGKSWAIFDTSKGLSWDFILGGDWRDDYIILATLGDGANISLDKGKTWKRYGYDFFGIEYLYTVGVKMQGGTKYMPTADGLVIFDDIANWHSCTEKEGLSSQYIYDMQINGDTILLGTLHGLSISTDLGRTWESYSPNGKIGLENIPLCKTRAVAMREKTIFAGCDDGLFVTNDFGKNWAKQPGPSLIDGFIHDLASDKDGNLWVGSYSGIGRLNSNNQIWETYGNQNGLPENNVNCVAIGADGAIYAGTNYGLFVLTTGDFRREEKLSADFEYFDPEAPVHQWMLRPVSPDEQNGKDQTYLYGSTMGGNFRQHQGNEYNNPEGVSLLAVDDGTIVHVNHEIGHSILKCDKKQREFFVYAHYHHQDEIMRTVGEHVKRGEIVGAIGKKGNVTNEHLHFEVSLSSVDDSDTLSHTRNSELWIEPLPDCGTIAGQLLDADNNPIPGARIYGVCKPIPTETPFSFAETYMDKVNPDEWYHENFAIGDVPEGEYIIWAKQNGETVRAKVKVRAGQVTRVLMKFE